MNTNVFKRVETKYLLEHIQDKYNLSLKNIF